MKMEVEIPDDISLKELKKGLTQIGDELHLDIVL